MDPRELAKVATPTHEDLVRRLVEAVQEWEGYVFEVREEEFEAQLLDLTAGDPVPREEATIPMTEIEEEDRATVAVGSVFRWVIGYERSPDGTRRPVSRIVFLDLPPVTERDLARGREWADRLRKKWGLE